jgi:hypothetical protein
MSFVTDALDRWTSNMPSPESIGSVVVPVVGTIMTGGALGAFDAAAVATTDAGTLAANEFGGAGLGLGATEAATVTTVDTSGALAANEFGGAGLGLGATEAGSTLPGMTSGVSLSQIAAGANQTLNTVKTINTLLAKPATSTSLQNANQPVINSGGYGSNNSGIPNTLSTGTSTPASQITINTASAPASALPAASTPTKWGATEWLTLASIGVAIYEGSK